MLLERSLSDRFYASEKEFRENSNVSGRQVIAVGFEISIDPQKEYKDAIAEAEIVIGNACSTRPPSLVMQLPNEKTYNVATITKNANSIGLGAIAKVIDIGFQFSKSKETLYLVKDTDTVSLQRILPYQSANENVRNLDSITLVWQFRPVLGQKAVTPGKRQVYALLALPNKNDQYFQGNVQVRTHWRKYDSKTRTAGELIANSENLQILTPLHIPPVSKFDNIVQPQIDSETITWTDAGNNLINVILNGQNFLSGTTVLLGDVVLDRPANGLIIQGERRIQFVTSAQKLASISSPMIISRYGQPVAILHSSGDPKDPKAPKKSDPDYGIQIIDTQTQPRDGKNSILSIKLAAFKSTQLKPNLNNRRLIVKIGDRIFLPGDPFFSLNSASNSVNISVTLPTQQLRDAGKITVRDFFGGDEYIAESEIKTDEFTATSLVNLANKNEMQQYAILGSNFTDSVKIQIGELSFAVSKPNAQQIDSHCIERSGSTLLLFKLTKEEAKDVKQMIITQGAAAPVILSFGDPKLATPEVNADSKKVTARQHDSKRFEIKGENLSSIKEIKTLNNQVVKFVPVSDTAIVVIITEEITKELGQKDLDFVLKDGKVINGITVTVLAN